MKTSTFFQTLLLTLLMVGSGMNSNGQQLPNNEEGVQWTYWFPAIAAPIISPRHYSLYGDTLIEDKLFYLSDFKMHTPEYEQYNLFLREDSAGMYYYDPIRREICTLYDYALQPGESYVIYPLLGETTDSLVVTLDSVRTEIIGGEMLRVQYVSTRSISHQEWQNHWVLGESFTENKAVIVEHIGSLGFLLPQEIAWDDDFSTGICSFNSGDFFYYTNDTIDCNFPIILSVQESVEQEVEIYPNPAKDFCNIANHSNRTYKIVITDTSGKQIYVSKISSNEIHTIGLINYNRGIYFVSFISSNNRKIKKIIFL